MLPSNIGHFLTALVAFFRAIWQWLLFISRLQGLFLLKAFLCDVCIIH